MEKIIEKYLKLQQEASQIQIKDDLKANKYNKIAKELFEMRKEIKKRTDFIEIFNKIIELSPWEKYATLHCDIAWSLQLLNPDFSKQIYLKYKTEPNAKHILKEFFWIIVD